MKREDAVMRKERSREGELAGVWQNWFGEVPLHLVVLCPWMRNLISVNVFVNICECEGKERSKEYF